MKAPSYPILAVGLMAFTCAPAAGGSATFQGLGDLPGDPFDSVALGVSADGSTVVGAGNLFMHASEAFMWNDGVMTGLGDLPGGLFESVAFGASADGSVIVGSGSSANGDEAFIWENGVMSGLGDLPGGTFRSSARDVSTDGSVVVGGGNSVTGWQPEPFRWVGAVMSGLGGLPGGTTDGEAYGVSSDGAIVVGWTDGANGTEAFRWENGVMSGLGDLPGGVFLSFGWAVSADGSVVVGFSSSESSLSPLWEAFRWESGTMTALGDLPGGFFASEARDVSGDGSVVVGGSYTGIDSGSSRAFVWTDPTGILNLNDVLTALGLDLSGWTLNYASAISDDGLTIVGYGYSPNGREGWIATVPADWIEQVTHELSVSIAKSDWAGWGTVDIEPNLARYLIGNPVTLTAQPNEGIAFKKWKLYDPNHPGDANHVVTDTNDVLTLVMTADREVVAVFKCAAGAPPLLSMTLALLGSFVVSRRRR